MSDILTVLPQAEDRWRPSRAGLVSVWRYWDETFTFHRGRLLLRGPNGSGKSMALEMLLPFLLDADASPVKLTSAARSRGGLFDRVMTGTDEQTRTGFAWVEFRRGGQVFTVGARIRATQATRKADVDYFTTTLGVGRDLQLLDSNRAPLSRRALVEAIGETGRVHTSGEEHRTAVREMLFPGFSADRYSSVIGALLALRKEKLSQHLDLDKLSTVLSEALPPIDEHDIAAVAEGFERLDRRRAELAALEAEVGEVRQLARRQRDYATAVVVSGAGQVRSAETRRDDVTRAERRAREDLDAARDEAARKDSELQTLEARHEAISVEIEALKDSDAYKEGAALADLRTHARRLAQVAERDHDAARSAQVERTRSADELQEANAARTTASANLDQARRDLGAAAEPVSAETVVAQAEQVEESDDAERLVRAWIGAQRSRISEVRDALDDHDRAILRRTLHETQRGDAETAVANRTDAHRSALGAADAAVEQYRRSVEQWAAGCEALGPEQVASALPQPPDAPAAVEAAVAALSSAVESDNAVARRDLEAGREAAGQGREQLEVERTRWAVGGLPDPETAPWRTERVDLPGAPLWRLVDPDADLSAEALDRLEAALTGAGLLDAWVQPDGAVALGHRADTVLTVRPAQGDTLASVLSPTPSGTTPPVVPGAVVAAVLSSIPLTPTVLKPTEPPPPPGVGGGSGAGARSSSGPEVAVGRDSSYRSGSAVGRGPDRPARLLGAPARERHRLARLAELDAAMAVIEDRLAELDRLEAALDRRNAALRAELADAPSGGIVDDARRAVTEAAARLGEAGLRLESARAAVREAEDEVRTALRALTALGSRHGLPTERGGLSAVDTGLGRLEMALTTWARRRREEGVCGRQLERSAARSRLAEEAALRAESNHTSSAREADEVEGRVRALESTIGAEYGGILDRIRALDVERAGGRERAGTLRQLGPELQRRVGELESTVRTAAEERERAEEDRELAHGRLVSMADGLGADAGIDAPSGLDSPSVILSFARAVAADHGNVNSDAETIERLSERVREQVHQARTALGSRVDVDRELTSDQWWVLRTIVGGLRRRAGDLALAVAEELDRGRAELAAEEEQLFEQTLAGSVRRALADRIRQANELVDGINAQLDAIRTAAAGVQVRLRWTVDADQLDAVKAARSLLLRDPADLSDEERSSLQAFVRARVDQARAELDANAPWEARLRETLDYRAWHRFTLQLAHRDWEGFQPATARRLQRLSTGERSIALHLPMIASVAAHYAGKDGASSTCPRLILLDELFAGVDSANRSQLFGTFKTWDLDAVFTSDHEWCQYASLDGIAIHHLHPPTGTDPVTSTRFTWDGRQRRVDADPTAA